MGAAEKLLFMMSRSVPSPPVEESLPRLRKKISFSAPPVMLSLKLLPPSMVSLKLVPRTLVTLVKVSVPPRPSVAVPVTRLMFAALVLVL